MTDEDMFPSLFAEAVVPARLADPGGRGALAGGAGGRAGAGALPGQGISYILYYILYLLHYYFLVKECTHEEYRQLIFPALRPVFGNPGKSIQASQED